MISDNSAGTEDGTGTGDSTGTESSGTESLLALDLTNATSDAKLVIDLGNVELQTLLDNAHNGVTAIGIAASTVDESVFTDVELNADKTAISLATDSANIFEGDSLILQNADSLNISASVYDATNGVLYVAANKTAIPEPSLFGLLAGTFALALASTRRRRSRR